MVRARCLQGAVVLQVPSPVFQSVLRFSVFSCSACSLLVCVAGIPLARAVFCESATGVVCSTHCMCEMLSRDPSCAVHTWRTGGCRACCAFSSPPLCGVLVALCYVHGFSCASGGFHRVSAWFNAVSALRRSLVAVDDSVFHVVSVCRMLRDGCEPSMGIKCWLSRASGFCSSVTSRCVVLSDSISHNSLHACVFMDRHSHVIATSAPQPPQPPPPPPGFKHVRFFRVSL